MFVAVGGLGILAALFLYMRGRKFLSTALSAQGRLADNVAGTDSEGGTVYYPVVEFTAADGQQVRFQGSVGSSRPKYQPGQAVPVRYSPTNPQDARLPGVFGMWFLPLLFGVMGIGFAAGGVFWLAAAPSADTEGAVPDVVASVAPALPSFDPASPLPSAAPGAGAVVSIQDGSGTGRVSESACTSLAKSGKKTREVALGIEDRTLTLRLKPYTGPGAYLPGQTAKVGGSFFEGAGPVSGAIIVDERGTGGVVNLVAGDRSVSGSWDCSQV